jgi:16S rRNA (uracil1498-N3)-methyltransferase
VNLLLLDPAEMGGAGGEVVIAGGDRRARHAREVLRVAVGQRLRAGVVRGATGQAEVLALEPDLRLRVLLDGPASPRPPVDLIAAVPRPKALSRLVQAAASLGVGRIDLVNAWRVDRSYLDSPRLAPAALAVDARLGCEQGGTTWVPELAVHRLLVPFLAAAPWPAGGTLLVAHPRGDALIEEAVPPGHTGSVVLAVGPEGGWIDRELASLTELGFRAVRLGVAVLRADTAVAALLAQIDLLRRLPGPGVSNA